MTNRTYLDFANSAIQMEKEEKYDLAAIEWGKAKTVATSLNAQLWCEYRQEHNEKRHSLHHSYSKALRGQKQNDQIEEVNKRTAAVLERHIENHIETNKFKQKLRQMGI
ncbi:ANR family transcriptional regulator [Xenorhabdus littoralis]|uniref:ANR family transcriptional regulator n=1 Tax=Xenorhabdus littoralis TaxID=2582835 RepID=UPI0029E820E3|nr:ANR family transcriptional regulator [Xenorhabdus sp. psl]MDX7992994.1 ANR family transcriptional regulator [Xenorhabdus sp. psl]